MKDHSTELLSYIAQTIYDKKGINILALDVQGLSSLTDYLIIAEGNVERHVRSLAQSLLKLLESYGEKPIRTEGLKTGDWVVLDYGPIMIHLFMPGLRENYSLEKLWQAGYIVDLSIDVGSSIDSV